VRGKGKKLRESNLKVTVKILRDAYNKRTADINPPDIPPRSKPPFSDKAGLPLSNSRPDSVCRVSAFFISG